MLAGIPAELREMLERAPEEQRVLLELRLRWPELDDVRARIAARLRVFMLTWDPLDWHDRPPARATATGEGDDYEVLLYVPMEQTIATAATAGEEIAVVLGDFAASVLAVGAAHERTLAAGSYPRLAFAGEAPGLLSQVGTLSDLPPPAISLASAWEPIGPAAIQDLVQEAFGPVDVDRAPVLLAQAAELAADCPACAGQRLGFPAELDDGQATMCAPHAAAARAIADERIQRGWESNREGMDALLGTSSMLTEPTYGLSLALLRDLDDASHRDARERPSRAQLACDAELALALAARLTGESELLGELTESDRLAPDWMVELPMALASGGLVDEAVAVGDAFAALDPEHTELFADDVALILAQEGRAAEALERVRQSAERGPRDVWTHVRAAAVHAELQDPQRAEASLRSALALARSRDDAEDVATVWDRLAGLLAEQPGREHESDAARQEADRWFDAAYGGTRIVAKVGRNDPCPCGSGLKYKRCCGG